MQTVGSFLVSFFVGTLKGATKVVRRKLIKSYMPIVGSVANNGPSLLQLAQIKVYDTEVWALLDLRALQV